MSMDLLSESDSESGMDIDPDRVEEQDYVKLEDRKSPPKERPFEILDLEVQL